MIERTREANKFAKINNRIDKLEKLYHKRHRGQVSSNFLESLVGETVVFLLTGRPCTESGILIGFDEYTIIISDGKDSQVMYFKHAFDFISN